MDLFEIRVRAVCPHTGNMRSLWRQFRGSKAEALEALAERELLHAELKGEVEPAPARQTLAVFAHSWLSTCSARGSRAVTGARALHRIARG